MTNPGEIVSINTIIMKKNPEKCNILMKNDKNAQFAALRIHGEKTRPQTSPRKPETKRGRCLTPGKNKEKDTTPVSRK